MFSNKNILFIQFDIFKIEFKIKFKKHSEARDLCEKYLKSHGTSKELWTLTLRAKLDESTTAAKDEPAVFELFKRAVASLKEKDTLDAWRLVIAWYVNNKCGTIEKLFEVKPQVFLRFCFYKDTKVILLFFRGF